MIRNIEQIKQQADIVTVVSHYVTIKKNGNLYEACCPKHQEQTPSFKVDERKNTFCCYGSCAKSGNAIDFVMWYDNLLFPEAVLKVAEICSISVEQDAAAPDPNEALYAAIAQVASVYQKALTEAAKDYLLSRGYTEETIAQLQIGYCTGKALAYSQPLFDCGVFSKNKSNQHFESFANRITFPISDDKGRVVGFTARKLPIDTSDRPKYINSRETPIYAKSGTVYGLSRAKDAIRKQGFAILCEGSTDVDLMQQSGLANTVACLGTSITDHHIVLLKRYTQTLVICLDGDGAGEKAALRALHKAISAGFGVYVLPLPVGTDPAEIIGKGGTVDVAAKIPAIEWIAKSAKALDSIARAQMLSGFRASIGAMADEIVKASYLKDLSDFLAVPQPESLPVPQEAETPEIQPVEVPALFTFTPSDDHTDVRDWLKKNYRISLEISAAFGIEGVYTYNQTAKSFKVERLEQPMFSWPYSGGHVIEAPKYTSFACVATHQKELPVFGWNQLPQSGKTLFVVQHSIEAMAIASQLSISVIACERLTDRQADELKERFAYIVFFFQQDARGAQKAWQGHIIAHKFVRAVMPYIGYTDDFPNCGHTLLEYFERGFPANELSESAAAAFQKRNSPLAALDYAIEIATDECKTYRIVTSPKGQIKKDMIANFCMTVSHQVQIDERSSRMATFSNDKGRVCNALISSQELNSLRSFRTFLYDKLQGTFSFTGNENDLQNMLAEALANEEFAKTLPRLGYHEGIGYVKGNAVCKLDGQIVYASDSGIVHIENEALFFPEAATIANKRQKWREQFVAPRENSVDLSELFETVYKMLGSQVITDILYSIACYHSTVIFNVDRFFPIYYLYGEGSIGKTERMKIFSHLESSYFEPIDLKGASTGASILDLLSKKVDAINMADEYSVITKEDVKNSLRGYYNRYGKSKMLDGQAVQHEIGSGLFMAGNDRIEDAPTLSRMIFVEVKRVEVTEEFSKLSRKLQHWREKGYHGLCLEIFKLRQYFVDGYKKAYDESKQELAGMLKGSGSQISRLVETASVLHATFKIVSKHITLPFDLLAVNDKLLENIKGTEIQVKAMQASDFWDIINILLNRTSEERALRLIRDWDYKFTHSQKHGIWLLELPMTHVYEKYREEVTRKKGLPKTLPDVNEWLKAQPYYVDERNSSKFSIVQTKNDHLRTEYVDVSNLKTLRFDVDKLKLQVELNIKISSASANEQLMQTALKSLLTEEEKEEEEVEQTILAIASLGDDLPF